MIEKIKYLLIVIYIYIYIYIIYINSAFILLLTYYTKKVLS